MTKDEEFFPNTVGRSAGDLLKEAREKHGLSIEDIESALKIKARHIEAIEYDDHDELPPRVYAIGFVKVYAEYMNLDSNRMVKLFKMKTIGRHADSVDLSSHGEVVTVSQRPSKMVICVCVVILGTLGVLIGERTAQKGIVLSPEQKIIPAVSDTLRKELEQKTIVEFKEHKPVSVEALPSMISEKLVSPPQDKKEDNIKIKAIYDSWIEVKNKEGKAVYSGILQMGRTYNVPTGEGYRLMTGNAGGTEIFVGEKSVGTLGRVSQVRKNVSLTRGALLQN